jgi:DNA repair protein RecN (Recombination protein N)
MLAIKTATLLSRSAHGARSAPPPVSDVVEIAMGAAARDRAPGLVFDEVDAGIGGRVADVVGRTLSALGSHFQVLCITHLPQIAAYADTHIHVAKFVEGGRTRTIVTHLDMEGRINEIGRMLSGAAITDGIRASALEMLQRSARRSPPGGASPLGRSESKSKGESESAKAKAPGGQRAKGSAR